MEYNGGIGGKIRKPHLKRPQPTPYARPVSSQSQTHWLSKLVDPAYRLISGGATRLLPSFFSKSLPSNSLSSSSDEEHDKGEAEVDDYASGEDELCNTNQRISTLSGLPGPSEVANKSENNSGFNSQQETKKKDSSAGIGNFDIELLIRGKTFSRDEANRLMEIIQSKALEPSNKVEDKKYPPLGTGKQAEQPVGTNKVLKTPHNDKQENLDRAMWGNLTPRPQSSHKLNEVAASPVDIARAYMSNRKTETGLLSDKMTPNDETALIRGDDQMLKPFVPSLSPNPSTGWPGAMSENQRGYLTPSSRQRDRYGLYNFPRTPYSRSIFSKSKPKGDAQNSVNTSSPLWKQSQTPAYDPMKSSYDPLDEATGSIGPIRRLRHNTAAATRSRGSAYVYPISRSERKVESSNFSRGSSLDSEKKLEPGEPRNIPLLHFVGNNSSEPSLPTVHSQSSQVARTILEHISRNPPTPKEKTEELKRAIAWKKTPSSGVQTLIPNGTNSSIALVRDSHEKVNQVDQNHHPQVSDKEKTTVGRDSESVNNNFSGMKSRLVNANSKHGDDAGLRINSFSKDVPKIVPAFGSKAGMQTNPSPAQMRPVFPSITISKPESRWTFSSDNSSGFTFPVSAASGGAISEPPTPSIFPSTTTGSNQPSLKAENAAPSYTFGSKRSSPPLVFSFPSTNSDTTNNNALDIKFSFGSSDNHTRLSFSSIGKDAVCC